MSDSVRSVLHGRLSTRSQNHSARSTRYARSSRYGRCRWLRCHTGLVCIALRVEGGHEPLAVVTVLGGLDEQRVEPVVRVGAVGHAEKRDASHVGESVAIARVVRPLRLDALGKRLDLRQTDGGRDVREPVVVADLVVHEAHGIFLGGRREMSRRSRKGVVLGEDHAAAAGRDDLVRVEGQRAREPDRARVPARERSVAPRRTEALGGVFDDGKAVFLARSR